MKLQLEFYRNNKKNLKPKKEENLKRSRTEKKQRKTKIQPNQTKQTYYQKQN